MSGRPENPSAFPREDYQTDDAPGQRGMTLRDYFAGQALTICLKDMDKSYSDWACEAYALADAMLAERENQP